MSELHHTPLYDAHIGLGAQMAPFAGYEMPIRYGAILDEHRAVRQSAGLFDVSHMGIFSFQGASARDLLNYLCCNDLHKLEYLRAQYTLLLNTKGGIVDDALLYRIQKEVYWLIVNASNIAKDWDWVQRNKDAYAMECEVTNISDAWSILALQGPKAQTILQPLTDTPLGEIPYYGFKQGRVADVGPLMISHTGYTRSGGYELYVPNKDAIRIWNALLAAGKPHGMVAAGLGARDTLRLESGMCLHGQDIDEVTSPLEARLDRIVHFNKNFIGKEALEVQKKEGVFRKLVGVKLNMKRMLSRGYELLDSEERKIGELTSGSLSPMLGIGIGLGYIAEAHSAAATKVWVQIRNKVYEAEVCRPPFWKA